MIDRDNHTTVYREKIMGLKVIGAGFGRTGTHSLAEALHMLGFGPCYHFLEINKNPGHHQRWTDALDGRAVDWDALYRNYVSAVEWPTVAFLPQILSAFPDARFILTHRDAEAWYASASTTIFEGLELSQYNPDPSNRASSAMKRRLVLDHVFGGKYRDKDHTIGVYQQHVRAVIALIPPHQLLQVHIGDGWPPLCDFLNVPIPDAPFPVRNDRANHRSQMPDWARKIKAQRDSHPDD